MWKKTVKAFWLSVLLAGAGMGSGCCKGEGEMQTLNLPAFSEVSPESWTRLAGKRIFFGHRSVGRNILDGVGDVLKDRPDLGLRVVESADLASVSGPALMHARVGENQYPFSKLEHFREILEKAGEAQAPDIAFLKFCYVDIEEGTDVQAVLSRYRQTLSELQASFPRTRFVHFTVPVKASPGGIKSWVKRLIGYPVKWTDPANVRRNDFNRQLLLAYGQGEPVFDLAGLESTHPDGRREYFRKDGEPQFTLVPAYTKDGGHLNELGRRVVAERLLAYLAGL